MDSIFSAAGLAVVAFVSTNIDDIFILVAFFADPKVQTRHVVLGQYLGIAALYGVSIACALVSLVIPSDYIGLLGLAPIAIGVKRLGELRRSNGTTGDEQRPVSGRGGTLAMAAVTIANGGDNIGVYTPLFVARSSAELAIVGIVFAVLTALWCVLAQWLVNHRTIGVPIRRYGHRIAPFVLIALGIMILYEAGTLQLLSRFS